MIKVLLVTPAWKRPELTEIMLRYRSEVLEPACEKAGVYCRTVVIADDENVKVARKLSHYVVESPNVLGAKFNDGYELAVECGYDWAFHVNSDQVFDPRLIIEIAKAPTDKVVTTGWLTAVHRSGKKCVSYRNPVRAMQAFPVNLLKTCPRPCAEDIMSGCDRSTMEGVVRAHPNVQSTRVEVSPLETVQFESEVQLTAWKRNLLIALTTGTCELPVPWTLLEKVFGEQLVTDMQKFYGKVQVDDRS